jgi:hypothetical protein
MVPSSRRDHIDLHHSLLLPNLKGRSLGVLVHALDPELAVVLEVFVTGSRQRNALQVCADLWRSGQRNFLLRVIEKRLHHVGEVAFTHAEQRGIVPHYRALVI